MPLIIYFIIAAGLFLTAMVSAMIGIGGGSLYTPIQVLFGIDVHRAAATSLFLTALLSLPATNVYRKARKIDWKLSSALLIVTTLGSFAGGYISRYIASDLIAIMLIVTLIFTSMMMIKNSSSPQKKTTKMNGKYCWPRKYGNLTCDINMALALPLSLVAGILSGILGIGGGVLTVPMMAVILGIPMGIAVGSSTFMVGITSIAGLSGHFIAGHLDLKLSLILAPIVLIGSYAGAHMMLKTGEDKLKKIFAIFMIIIAAALVIRQL